MTIEQKTPAGEIERITKAIPAAHQDGIKFKTAGPAGRYTCVYFFGNTLDADTCLAMAALDGFDGFSADSEGLYARFDDAAICGESPLAAHTKSTTKGVLFYDDGSKPAGDRLLEVQAAINFALEALSAIAVDNSGEMGASEIWCGIGELIEAIEDIENDAGSLAYDYDEHDKLVERIKAAGRDKLTQALEGAGCAVYDDEPLDDLIGAVLECIDGGDIEPTEF